MKMLSDDKVAEWSVNKVCSGKGWNQETSYYKEPLLKYINGEVNNDEE